MIRSNEEKFVQFFRSGADEECWPWLGGINPNGYDIFNVYVDGRRTTARPHRFSYEFFVGPIPEGLEIDHLCRNRSCVNPAHLEPVTRSENIRRAEMASGEGTFHGRKTHCPQGHPYDEANTYRHGGRRGCRICRADNVRRFFERQAKSA